MFNSLHSHVPSLIDQAREAAAEVTLQNLPDERYYQFDVLADRRGVMGSLLSRLYIPLEDMEWFVNCSYSAVSIAQSLGVHPNTICQ